MHSQDETLSGRGRHRSETHTFCIWNPLFQRWSGFCSRCQWMWACPNLISGAFWLILAPCSLLPVFPVSGGCVEQRNHSIYSSYPLSTSGSHSKRLYFFQALLLGSLYWTLGFSFILSYFLLNNCLCFQEESWSLFSPILSTASKGNPDDCQERD